MQTKRRILADNIRFIVKGGKVRKARQEQADINKWKEIGFAFFCS